MGRKATWFLLDKLLILFTIAVLCAAYACRYLPEAPLSGGWLLAGIAVPALFAVNSILLIWWLLRGRWFVALIPVAALVVGASDIANHLQPPAIHAPMECDLRIATLNVHAFQHDFSRGLSARRIASMLRDEQIDIACLQEVVVDADHPFDYIATRFSDYMPYYVRDLSMCCFSRHPILNHEYVRFPNSNQSYLRVDVQIGTRTVRLLSVHLQTSGLASARQRIRRDYQREMPIDTLYRLLTDNAVVRASQVATVRKVIDSSDLPLLVLGDFNDTPASPTYRTMSRGLTNAFRTAGHGWSGSFRDLLTIDYILYNDYFEATDCYVWRNDRLSDHAPVIAGVRFVR
ncbi:MAG: endonuclease/exonuclease/phosphatase family protein [Alistipes sp.]